MAKSLHEYVMINEIFPLKESELADFSPPEAFSAGEKISFL